MTSQQLLADGIRYLEKHHTDLGVRHDHALDAELLLAQVLRKPKLLLLMEIKKEVEPEAEAAYRKLLERRANHEPVAYITGSRDFYSLTFKVRPGVLIPRPETELLVDLALEHLRFAKKKQCIVDVGTGSGAIAVALAANTGEKIFATEFSPNAFEIARENIAANNFSNRIQLLAGNGIEPVTGKNACKGAEELLIVANLPYLPTQTWADSMPDVKNFEPREALDGGADGLDLYRVLLNQLQDPGSHRPREAGVAGMTVTLIAEIDPSQAETLPAEIKKRFPNAETAVHNDLTGRARAVLAKGLSHDDVSK